MVMLFSFAMKYRERVLKLKADIQKFQKSKLAIHEKFTDIEDAIPTLDIVWYKPRIQEEIDVYMADYCNSAGKDLGVKRVQPGTYNIAGSNY